MQRPRPLTIEEQGLEKFLNETADKHGGHGYDYIVPLFESDVNNANIAKVYKVKDWRTVKHWREVWEKENA